MKTFEVGGFVRDSLMGIESNDRDYVVIGSTADEMLALGFQQVGAAFPVFLHPETQDEYALARTEKKVGIGYGGFECVFTPDVTLEDDQSRRDLTINAIARDPVTGEYFDPYNGMTDIRGKTLRHVSDAFSDDPLRVIRLARFYARFEGFVVAPETVVLAEKIAHSGELNAISNERYWAELMKVFSDDTCNIGKFFSALGNFGVLKKTNFFTHVFGNFDLMYSCEEFHKICAKIQRLSPDLKAAVFVALFENNAPLQLQCLPNRVGALVVNFRKIKLTDFSNVSEIYDIIAATRSLNETTQSMMDLACCMKLGNMRSELNRLLSVSYRVHEVTAEPFMHLSGKQIGLEMMRVRKEKIAEYLTR
jgi:tRNA nucleotidyltransferase/poly(A) polymerase